MPLEYLTLGAKILDAIKILFGFKDALSKARADRRAKMAVLFEQVAVCLDDAAKQIRADTYPAGRCAELLTYAVELPIVVRDELGQSKADEIGSALQQAHQVERLYMDRDKPEGKKQLREIDEAAGLLRALANIVRV